MSEFFPSVVRSCCVALALPCLANCSDAAFSDGSSPGGFQTATATASNGGNGQGAAPGDLYTLPDGSQGIVNDDGNVQLPDGTIVDKNGNVLEPSPGPDPQLPAEQEVEGSFRAPVATGRFLWTANPHSSRVALIDTRALDVILADAGFGPTYLAPVPTDDDDVSRAIVLNVLSHDATLLTIDAARDVSGVSFPVHAGANGWAVSPSGKWATAWTDAAGVESPDPTDGFQDITIISLENQEVTRLSVGYRPSQLAYDSEETRLFVVTEPGISVIDLEAEAPTTVDLVSLGDGQGVPGQARDVSITPDGALALVRPDGAQAIGVASLEDGDYYELALSGVVTDLDLSKDGRRAAAVVRDTSEFVVLDVDQLPDPGAIRTLAIEGAVFGSVALSPEADVAVLFTNAVAETQVTIVSLAEGEQFLSHRRVDVQAPVRAVVLSPDGEHGVALLDVPEGSHKAGAFSLLVTKDQRAPKIVGTDAPPVSVAISPDIPSERAVVTTRDDQTGTFAVHLVRLPTLQVDRHALASPPLASGIIRGQGLGYVAQEHPEGRITFVDLEDGDAQTLTGFELAVKVVD